ncbi:putative histone-lysine N-methyltransferase set-23 [Aphelenchoides fujianensis]|nr:putative histone-lysine N-methyltransferase set-23 [Aphelenchoides fujianensis]
MDFEYIQRNVPSDSSAEAENAEDFDYDLAGCSCEGACRPSTSDPSSGCSCLSYGKEIYDQNGCLLLEEESNVPILECHENCGCAPDCGNRAAQFGLQLKVEPFLAPNGKGLGLRAGERIPRGRFVIEYAGEIVSAEEANERCRRYKAAGQEHHYIFTLKEHSGDSCTQTFIDATKKGNLARLINHSCAPNLAPTILRYGRAVPVCALFARRDIEAGEELSYDYGRLTTIEQDSPVDEANGKPCRCGATNCRHFLPFLDYDVANFVRK